jgi:hypothetical protein
MLNFAVMKRKRYVSPAKILTMATHVVIAAILLAFANEAGAQNRDKQRRVQVDSMLAARYYRNGGIDTAYLQRPTSKWTITAKANVSGIGITNFWACRQCLTSLVSATRRIYLYTTSNGASRHSSV